MDDRHQRPTGLVPLPHLSAEPQALLGARAPVRPAVQEHKGHALDHEGVVLGVLREHRVKQARSRLAGVGVVVAERQLDRHPAVEVGQGDFQQPELGDGLRRLWLAGDLAEVEAGLADQVPGDGEERREWVHPVDLGEDRRQVFSGSPVP